MVGPSWCTCVFLWYQTLDKNVLDLDVGDVRVAEASIHGAVGVEVRQSRGAPSALMLHLVDGNLLHMSITLELHNQICSSHCCDYSLLHARALHCLWQTCFLRL